MRIEARTLFKENSKNHHTTVVWVQGLCGYRVTFDDVNDTVTIIAPGKEVEVEYGDERFRGLLPDEEEACAIALVAMIEGGIEL